MTDMEHMRFLRAVVDEDVRELERKEATYKGSWKRRGGVGAFMMMARKWDRLEGMLAVFRSKLGVYSYDVFQAVEDASGGEDGTALAEIRDLRRYLTLVEAEMMARGAVKLPTINLPGNDALPGSDCGFITAAEARHILTLAPLPQQAPVTSGEAWGHIQKDVDELSSRPVPLTEENHHAERATDDVLWPFEISKAGLDLWNPQYYSQYSPDHYRLKEVMAGTSAPLHSPYMLMNWVDGGRTLMLDRRRVKNCKLPPLSREVNSYELSQLPWWHRMLYEYHTNESKYVIQDQYAAWWMS